MGVGNMIELKNLNFKYGQTDGGTVDDINLEIGRGETVLLCGRSGCGKTTVTRFINGLIPHYYEGQIGGRIIVDGIDVRKTPMSVVSKKVGSVFQNPRSQFFCVDTSGEIIFGCENAGLKRSEILERYLETAHRFKIENLMGRDIFKLSGGEKQKVACASAVPRVLKSSCWMSQLQILIPGQLQSLPKLSECGRRKERRLLLPIIACTG